MHITPEARGFSAQITGLDLSRPLDEETVREIRAAWHAHQVVYFPDQPMTHEDLERFTRYIGAFGEDPYIAPLADNPHILELRREPDEKAIVFGASWHSDWSFLATPPAATILHAKVIPPVGGDTLFASGYLAYDALGDAFGDAMKERVGTLFGIHSAAMPYGDEGVFAKEKEVRTMKILPSVEANRTQRHPLVRVHPETGQRSLFVNQVYTIRLEGPDLHTDQASALLKQLCEHATQDRFVYRHRWQPDMLIVWDNRCVQHSAQGGYDGHRRLMHRTTVAGEAPMAA